MYSLIYRQPRSSWRRVPRGSTPRCASFIVPRVLTDGTASWYSELEEITDAGPTGDELMLDAEEGRHAVQPQLRGHRRQLAERPGRCRHSHGRQCRADRRPGDPQRCRRQGPGRRLFGQAGQHVAGAVTIDSLIDAAGLVADVGGQARVAYVNPTNHTALMKEKDAERPPAADTRLLGRAVEHDLRLGGLADEGRRRGHGAGRGPVANLSSRSGPTRPSRSAPTRSSLLMGQCAGSSPASTAA